MENQTEKRVKVLRTDNDLEFYKKEFDQFCRSVEINRHRIAPYTPKQNGVAERMNKNLLDKVRCMLIRSSVPKVLWGEALMTVSYIVNRTPLSALGDKTPEKQWTAMFLITHN